MNFNKHLLNAHLVIITQLAGCLDAQPCSAWICVFAEFIISSCINCWFIQIQIARTRNYIANYIIYMYVILLWRPVATLFTNYQLLSIIYATSYCICSYSYNYQYVAPMQFWKLSKQHLEVLSQNMLENMLHEHCHYPCT